MMGEPPFGVMCMRIDTMRRMLNEQFSSPALESEVAQVRHSLTALRSTLENLAFRAGEFVNVDILGAADHQAAAPAKKSASVTCSRCRTPHMAKTSQPTRTGVLLTFTCQNPFCGHRWSAGITRGRC